MNLRSSPSRFRLTSASIPDGPQDLMVLSWQDPPRVFEEAEAAEVEFFSAEMVPFDFSVDP